MSESYTQVMMYSVSIGILCRASATVPLLTCLFLMNIKALAVALPKYYHACEGQSKPARSRESLFSYRREKLASQNEDFRLLYKSLAISQKNSMQSPFSFHGIVSAFPPVSRL